MNKKDKINSIIKNSGHTFHYQVVNLLRERGWFVLVSPYYRDNITDKSREIDIVAEREFDVRYCDQWMGTLNARLFIECKQINQEHVFWFDDKNHYKAIKRIMEDTPLESPEKNTKIKKHHYFIGEKVAKLFASSSDRQLENEPIYKAINQSLHSTIYYRDLDSIIPPKKNKPTKILLSVPYPIILLNSFSQIYRVDPPEQKPYKIDDNFLIEINYAYFDENKKSKNEYFLIDVVEFNKLASFLDNLEKADSDIGTIRDHLSYRFIVKDGSL